MCITTAPPPSYPMLWECLVLWDAHDFGSTGSRRRNPRNCLVSVSCGAGITMKASVGICLVFCFAMFGLGSSIRCYKCKHYADSCTTTEDCSQEDACLTFKERGGDTVRQCIKYSQCDYNILSQMFPNVASFSFHCCKHELCNGAVSIVGSRSLLGLLLSLAVMWWCMH